MPLQNKLCFGHGGKVCRVLGEFLSLKEFIFDRVASRVTFILRLPDLALQKSDQKLEICSEEESEDLSSQMLSSSFLVIHDSAGGGHDDVTENKEENCYYKILFIKEKKPSDNLRKQIQYYGTTRCFECKSGRSFKNSIYNSQQPLVKE